MPTESPPTKPKRETWRDWARDAAPDVPEPTELLSREGFLAELNRLSLDVDEGDLRFWEYHGVLPRVVRQWDPERRANVARYPPWMIAAVLLLRESQGAGLSLQQIASRLRSHAGPIIRGAHTAELLRREAMSNPELMSPVPLDDPGWKFPAVLRALRGPAWPAVVVNFALSEPVRVAIADEAARFARITGTEEAVHAEVSLRDREGNEIGLLSLPLTTLDDEIATKRNSSTKRE
ncbi:MAG: hypothetical protein M3Q71_08145 [Chloroflexota bacterium]|nr:hypothetical protein [Chloroflexota bacterium]